MGISSLPPTRRTVRSWSARRSLTWVQGDISPTSSRKSVPRLAASNIPFLSATAPVNEPLAWPKSSLSSRFSGRAAQLMETNGLSRRGLREWIARAAISFPVPLSPVMRTVESVVATFSMRRIDLLHRPALADHLLEAVAVLEVPLEEDVLLLEAQLLEAAGDDDLQLLDVEGLDDVIQGAGLQGVDGLLDAAVGGDHDDRDLGVQAFDELQDVHAARLGHLDVGDDEVDGLFLEDLRAWTPEDAVLTP